VKTKHRNDVRLPRLPSDPPRTRADGRKASDVVSWHGTRISDIRPVRAAPGCLPNKIRDADIGAADDDDDDGNICSPQRYHE
jgi:hypothetical protein